MFGFWGRGGGVENVIYSLFIFSLSSNSKNVPDTFIDILILLQGSPSAYYILVSQRAIGDEFDTPPSIVC